ncbi:hypothetical protein R1sor_004817 [Riccia sorocarpa]|uniref:Uncharacterized protein n=1 Tax=Riccia sorocarpa TaxID=122646 RepID=A0ABD3HM28_9MARC
MVVLGLLCGQMDPTTVEIREGDIPVAAVQVPPSSAVDDVIMDDDPVEVGVASVPPTFAVDEVTMDEIPEEVGDAFVPAYNHEVKQGQIKFCLSQRLWRRRDGAIFTS